MSGKRNFAAVFFDLDGTLVSERIGVREARTAVGERLVQLGVWDKPPTAFADTIEMVIGGILADNDHQWPLWLNADEWLQRSLTAAALSVNEDEFKELSGVYRTHRSDKAQAIAGWQAALAAARQHGPIGLITNFNDGPMQRGKIAGAGLAGQFDGLYISGEMGVWKPEPEIFHRAAADLGAAAAECVHIGNSIISDIEGAQAAGMAAVLVEEDERPRPENLAPSVHWCANLAEVAAWLSA